MNREYHESEVVLEMSTGKIITSVIVITLTLMALAFGLGVVVANEPTTFQPTPDAEPMTSGQIIWRDLQWLGDKVLPR